MSSIHFPNRRLPLVLPEAYDDTALTARVSVLETDVGNQPSVDQAQDAALAAALSAQALVDANQDSALSNAVSTLTSTIATEVTDRDAAISAAISAAATAQASIDTLQNQQISLALQSIDQVNNNLIDWDAAQTAALAQAVATQATTDAGQDAVIATLATSSALSQVVSDQAAIDAAQDATIATLATSSALAQVVSDQAIKDSAQDAIISTLATTSALNQVVSDQLIKDNAQDASISQLIARPPFPSEWDSSASYSVGNVVSVVQAGPPAQQSQYIGSDTFTGLVPKTYTAILEMGNAISFDIDGEVTALKVWNADSAGISITVCFWQAGGAGTLLAQGTISSAVVGWNTFPLSTAVSVTAGTVYVVSNVVPPDRNYIYQLPLSETRQVNHITFIQTRYHIFSAGYPASNDPGSPDIGVDVVFQYATVGDIATFYEAVNSPTVGVSPVGNGDWTIRMTGFTDDGSDYSSVKSDVDNLLSTTLAGEVSGSFQSTVVSDAAVLSRPLTNFATSSGAVSSADTVLSAFGKLAGTLQGDISCTTLEVSGMTELNNTLSATVIFCQGLSSSGNLTLSNGANLNVSGNTTLNTLSMATGSGDGKVLTSDSTGVATWQTPSATAAIAQVVSDQLIKDNAQDAAIAALSTLLVFDEAKQAVFVGTAGDGVVPTAAFNNELRLLVPSGGNLTFNSGTTQRASLSSGGHLTVSGMILNGIGRDTSISGHYYRYADTVGGEHWGPYLADHTIVMRVKKGLDGMVCLQVPENINPIDGASISGGIPAIFSTHLPEWAWPSNADGVYQSVKQCINVSFNGMNGTSSMVIGADGQIMFGLPYGEDWSGNCGHPGLCITWLAEPNT